MTINTQNSGQIFVFSFDNYIMPYFLLRSSSLPAFGVLWGLTVLLRLAPLCGGARPQGGLTINRLISNTENNVKSLIKLRKFRPKSFTPKVIKISLLSF